MRALLAALALVLVGCGSNNVAAAPPSPSWHANYHTVEVDRDDGAHWYVDCAFFENNVNAVDCNWVSLRDHQ